MSDKKLAESDGDPHWALGLIGLLFISPVFVMGAIGWVMLWWLIAHILFGVPMP